MGWTLPKTSFSSFIWSHIHIHHYTKWARKPTKPKVKKFPLESQSSRRKPIGPDIFSTHKTTWHGPNFVCKNPRFIISLLTSKVAQNPPYGSPKGKKKPALGKGHWDHINIIKTLYIALIFKLYIDNNK